MSKKKLPRKLLTYVLTLGASLTLGLLSFSGAFVFTANLPLAIALASSAFVLSTIYEGQIYLKNIKDSLKKLIQPNYLKREMAKKFLDEIFNNESFNKQLHDENQPLDPSLPPLISDYISLRNKLNKLDKNARKEKKHYNRAIKQIEKWFTDNVFPKIQFFDINTLEINNWIAKNNLTAGLTRCQNQYQRRKKAFFTARIFSLIAGVFMGLGTAYLLAEPLAVIPFLAAMAATPMGAIMLFAVLSGLLVAASIAYALLTYNCITDMIQQEVIKNWLMEIKNLFSEKFTWSKFFKALGIVTIMSSAIALTLCTAGTWWTIAKTGRPFFHAFQGISRFLMKFINPVIMAIAAGAFNISNTYESYEEIGEGIKKLFKAMKGSIFERIKTAFTNLGKKESYWRIFNPFRFILNLCFFPTRVLLFLGHLASIGATADRVPKIPELFTAFFVAGTEGLEDFHYIFGNKQDIPTRLLKIALSPLFLISAGWDCLGGMLWGWLGEKHVISFGQACKNTGLFIFDYMKEQDNKPLPRIEIKSSTHRAICQQMLEKAIKKNGFDEGQSREIEAAISKLDDVKDIHHWLATEKNKTKSPADGLQPQPVYSQTIIRLFDKLDQRYSSNHKPAAPQKENLTAASAVVN